MKVGIAGYGFVGQAHEYVISDDLVIYDPLKGMNGDLTRANCIIICVSTPQHDDGSCDISNIVDVVSNVPNVPILIKSTISIEGWRNLLLSFPDKQLAFSPEFLTAKNAKEDLFYARNLWLGGESINFWLEHFARWWPAASTIIAEPEELILTKYFRNAYLATKVSFFNQVYDLCESLGVDFDTVKQSIGNDERIGHSHTNISKERGYGGHCFPKDIAALLDTAERNNVDLSLINTSKNYNNKIRK